MNEPAEQSERKEKYLTEEYKRQAVWPVPFTSLQFRGRSEP